MAKKQPEDKVLGRDPFAGMEETEEDIDRSETQALGRDPFADLEWRIDLDQDDDRPILGQAAPVSETDDAAPSTTDSDQEAASLQEPAPSRPHQVPFPGLAKEVVREESGTTPVAQPATPRPAPEVRPPIHLESPDRKPVVRLTGVAAAQPATALIGKGVWTLYSQEIDRAIEMALAIGATHVICKTGDRGMLFVEAARRVYARIRKVGLIPFAWTALRGDDPIAEAQVAIKSARLGYEGIVFDVEDQTREKGISASAMGRQLMEAGLHPSRLYYASYPNIWQHQNIPYREMNEFCRGGFMPKCYPSSQRTPGTVIKKWAYGEHERWSKEWGNMPPILPILAAYKDEQAALRLGVQEFLKWAQALTAHFPPFYSLYRAGTTNSELWSILAALGEAPPAPPPQPSPAEPAPVPEHVESPQGRRQKESALSVTYYVVTVNDSVWSICERYSISREQFWEWNGHIWDDLWLPRDGIYLQEGWRVRVA